MQELASDLTGPIVLGENLSQPGNLIASLVDQLIVMDDLPPNADVGEAATLLPRSRGAGKDSLNNWVLLPFGGPQQIVLTGVATEAEQGLKTSRHGAKHARPGERDFRFAVRFNGRRCADDLDDPLANGRADEF